jgi:hypothetical protein
MFIDNTAADPSRLPRRLPPQLAESLEAGSRA